METATFEQELNKYKKVRSSSYQGKLARALRKEDLETDANLQQQGSQATSKPIGASTQKVLDNAPFFKHLIQKLAQLDPTAKDSTAKGKPRSGI